MKCQNLVKYERSLLKHVFEFYAHIILRPQLSSMSHRFNQHSSNYLIVTLLLENKESESQSRDDNIDTHVITHTFHGL